jgi:hypothetical protein
MMPGEEEARSDGGISSDFRKRIDAIIEEYRPALDELA